MKTTIVLAGATGNLGGNIIDALLKHDVNVRVLVRNSIARDKLEKLEQRDVQIFKLDLSKAHEFTKACEGASCVVSALQGLRDVIVDTQSRLLDAAIAAGVTRFIPSDFSIDFTKFPNGQNRNLDLRREFHLYLDKAPIAATSIMNGAFAYLLIYTSSILDLNNKRVKYWGNADQLLDFTTVENTAAFTAAAALDSSAPRILRIAGSQITARELANLAGELTKSKFEIIRMGSLDELAASIEQDRASVPESENQIFPRWQGNQYLYNMFNGIAKSESLDNNRYSEIRWTSVRDVIETAIQYPITP